MHSLYSSSIYIFIREKILCVISHGEKKYNTHLNIPWSNLFWNYNKFCDYWLEIFRSPAFFFKFCKKKTHFLDGHILSFVVEQFMYEYEFDICVRAISFIVIMCIWCRNLKKKMVSKMRFMDANVRENCISKWNIVETHHDFTLSVTYNLNPKIQCHFPMPKNDAAYLYK